MARKLIENANLDIKQRPKLELVSNTDYSGFFFSFCEDIEIVLEKLETKHLIFVIEAGDHDLVLGQFFLNSIKFSQEYKLDRIYNTIIYLYIYQTAVFHTLTPQDPAN